MERNNLRHSLKDQPMKDSYHSYKLKDWITHGDHDHDFLAGFPWPPRSYTCSFCKREFRSAQALGGHMNVHRRDRARLRVQSSPPPPQTSNDGQLSTFLSPKRNANPKPNCSSSVMDPPPLVPFASDLLSSSLAASAPSPLSPGNSERKRTTYTAASVSPKPKDLSKSYSQSSKTLYGLGAEFKRFVGRDPGCKFSKKDEILSLDLDIGLISGHLKEENLDLELRLGYS